MVMRGGFCLAFAVLLVLSALPIHAQQAPVISEVIFQGIEGLPADVQTQLNNLAAGVKGQPYTAERVSAFETAIRELGYFARVEVRTETVGDNRRLVVVLTPNPAITGVAFIGNTVLSTEELRAAVNIPTGQVLNQTQIRAAAEAIQAAYARRGYVLTQVTDVSVTPEGVLQFTITEPKVSEIRIEGNTRTRAETIRCLLAIKPDEVYNQDAVRRSLINLQRLGIFEDVVITPQPGTDPGTVLLIVTVRERRTGYFNLGGTYSQPGGFSGFIDISEANLFGRAQRLSAHLQAGARKFYQLSYFNPLLDCRPTSLGANLYRTDIPHEVFRGEAANEAVDFDETRTGGNLILARPVSLNLLLQGTLRIDHERTKSTGNTPLPAVLQEDTDVRSLALAGIRDTRLNPLYPTAGSYALAQAEQAGLLGGAAFTRLNAEYRRYWAFGGRPATETRPGRTPRVFASRLLAGTSFGHVPVPDLYYAGGAVNIRGFREGRFPGKNTLVWQNELRVPFSESLYGVAFVDVGDAWGGAVADEFGDPNLKLRAGYGLGIRLVTPAGPLRVDFGFNSIGGNQFHFGFGPTF